MSDINIEKIKEYVKKGGNYVLSTAQEILWQDITERENEAFAQGIEFGIQNTIAALYDAGVEDDNIIQMLGKYWGISMEEALKRLVLEKYNAVSRALTQFLKLEGYSETEIRSFMIQNNVRAKIKRDKELIKFRRKPEELMHKVIEQN